MVAGLEQNLIIKHLYYMYYLRYFIIQPTFCPTPIRNVDVLAAITEGYHAL